MDSSFKSFAITTFILLSAIQEAIGQDLLDYDSTSQDNRCVELRAEDLGAYNTTLLYEWKFGDGEIGTGLIVSHCYEKDGAYKATLSVVDPDSEARFEDEYALDIFINCEFALDIEINKSTKELFNLFGILKSTDSVQNPKFYWDINGNYLVGKDQKDVSVPPSSQIRLLVKFKLNDEEKSLSKTITTE